MSIRDNYQRILEDMATACARSSRKMEDVQLLAVTKFVSVERIQEALELGITRVGENRAQELVEKLDFFTKFACEVHFIGQLQTNKVKYITGQVDLVQSVDRPQLAQELQRQAKLRNVEQDVLIEVNIGEESQKGGIAPDALIPFLASMEMMPNLHVKGLMCIPPALGEEQARPYFAKMRQLFERVAQQRMPHIQMQHLSMGMTGDFRAAIEEGATIVRIGTGLFGARL